ncbi:PFP-ALPHA [Symbiodinium pilosum]|uniref:PFP-ALPHA protein n=1 Tax=Symbiodinium pilosum TaxID=2952 RepID=A0A812W2W0_SYMPI|nr:PFP-ALPHA [Symbiodinium pilosum]
MSRSSASECAEPCNVISSCLKQGRVCPDEDLLRKALPALAGSGHHKEVKLEVMPDQELNVLQLLPEKPTRGLARDDSWLGVSSHSEGNLAFHDSPSSSGVEAYGKGSSSTKAGLVSPKPPKDEPITPSLGKLDLRRFHQRIGIALIGRSGPGINNVIMGLFDYVQAWSGTVVCIAMGLAGLVNGYSFELTEELLAPHRNQGGCDLLGQSQPEDIEKLGGELHACASTCRRLKLDGLVVWGGSPASNVIQRCLLFFLDVDGWEAVRAILSAYFPIQDMAFSAGLADGRHFTFEKGQTSMSTPLAMASSSKFPAAIAIAGCVAEGHLTFDTFAHEVFPWWTSDPAVPKSRVTLRNLMSFTSGFYSPDTGGSVPCLGANASVYTAEACAREIYDLAPFLYEPGTTWAYNSFHLQVAGAMAAYAAGISVQELLHRYLIQPLKLNATMWMGGGNPGLAGNMMTTGNDYDRILRAYVGHELIPEKVSKEMERDYLDGVQVANSSTFLVQLLGHYSMCNYFECFPPKTSGFTDQCKRANVHMDAGLFGYYPLVDRAKGMYMQIVTMKFPQSQATYFAPTIASMALRLITKGWVDKALRLPTQETNKLRTRTIMHEAPGLLLKLASACSFVKPFLSPKYLSPKV